MDFDGLDQGVLLEAKCTGYAKWVDDDLNFYRIFKGAPKMLEQAKSQLEVANGTPIRWIVAEEKLAGALKRLFKANGLGDIEVVHTPPRHPTPRGIAVR